ncbi:hypothetical protein [Nonomuraea sp. NPDC049695]|uniref:hypothetical protein n=1 Tax=Nonomuraea sp. NPDC049695 TaxID=3154734 RepID=UPI00343722DD
MSAMREELHSLVDQLPDDRVQPMIAFVRESLLASRRTQAAATLEGIRERMRGVTGVDGELARLREGA